MPLQPFRTGAPGVAHHGDDEDRIEVLPGGGIAPAIGVGRNERVFGRAAKIVRHGGLLHQREGVAARHVAALGGVAGNGKAGKVVHHHGGQLRPVPENGF